MLIVLQYLKISWLQNARHIPVCCKKLKQLFFPKMFKAVQKWGRSINHKTLGWKHFKKSEPHETIQPQWWWRILHIKYASCIKNTCDASKPEQNLSCFSSLHCLPHLSCHQFFSRLLAISSPCRPSHPGFLLHSFRLSSSLCLFFVGFSLLLLLLYLYFSFLASL